MPVYNKLKIAIFTIISSQSIHALTFEPIKILSGSGNLLYAEMKFSNANPNARIEASLAETQDFLHLGTTHQPPEHLNFFTRKSQDGTGVIVITSSRPMVESELNILLKIKEGNATHIQQVKKQLSRPTNTAKFAMSSKEQKLQPQTVTSEKDIALNLPTSNQFQPTKPIEASFQMTNVKMSSSSSTYDIGTPLVINVTPVPPLNTKKITSKIVIPTTTTTTNQAQTYQIVTPTIINETTAATSIRITTRPLIQVVAKLDTPLKNETLAPEDTTLENIDTNQISSEIQPELEQFSMPKVEQKTSQPQLETIPDPMIIEPTIPTQPSSHQEVHIVQANESLWKIAERISFETKQSIPEIMQKIKADNVHAFIGGNVNRIRRGVTLNVSNSYNPQIKAQPRNTTPTTANKKPSTKTKYTLPHAEMSLVADSNQKPGLTKSKEKTSQNQTTPELSSKVMTAREKTVKLQKSVSQRSLALQQKDQRIQLLNARLAHLQQQLQQQQREAK